MITHKRTINICLATLLLILFYSCAQQNELDIQPISKEFNDEYLTGKGLDTNYFNTSDVMQYYQVSNYTGLTAEQILSTLNAFSISNYIPGKLVHIQ